MLARPLPQGEMKRRPLPSLFEKPAQQLRRPRLLYAAIDFRAMMTGGGSEKAHARFDRTAFRIGGGVIKPADAGERDRRRATGAGAQRDGEDAAGKALRAGCAGGGAGGHAL